MTRTILILALAITAACSSPDPEAELRASCNDLVDRMAEAGSCVGDVRDLHLQCDVGPVNVTDCTDDLQAYYDCLVDAVWECRPDTRVPTTADPFACAEENELLERCYRGRR